MAPARLCPGLEKELVGLAAGDTKDVVVQPEEGYGMPDPEGVFGVPRAAFPPDAKLSVGDSFIGEDDEGQALPVRVVELREDVVVVDAATTRWRARRSSFTSTCARSATPPPRSSSTATRTARAGARALASRPAHTADVCSRVGDSPPRKLR